jgi:DNA replication protein
MSTTCEECGYVYDTVTCPCGWYNKKFNGYPYATIDDFNQDIINMVKSSLMDETTTRTVLLYGPSGSGKTHMAIACAKDICLRNGFSFDFDLIDPDTLSDLPSTRDQQLAHFRKVKLLIIDEFNDSFFLLLNYRIRHGLYTICTTNINIEKFDTKFVWRITPFLIQDSGIDTSKIKKQR